MPHYTLTQKAMTDLLEIVRYTQKQWGIEQRNIYLSMINGCFQEIAADPLKGKDCSAVKEGYRENESRQSFCFLSSISKQRRSNYSCAPWAHGIETRLSTNQD